LEIWESIAVNIMEKNKFTFSSKFEANIAASLGIMGIGFSYQNLKFYIEYDNEIITYTPDFVLQEKKDSKTVLIEPHGKKYMDERFFHKMHAYKENPVSKEYYLILITDKEPKKPDKLKIGLKKYGYRKEDICDELWYIPYNNILDLQLSIKNEHGSIYSKLASLKRSESEENIPIQMLRRPVQNLSKSHAQF